MLGLGITLQQSLRGNVRLNLLTFSEQFDNAVWAKSTATVTADQAVAPDTTTTMDRLTASVGLNIHAVSEPFTFTSGQQYTFSCYVKYVNNQYVSLRIFDSSVFPHVTFDLVDGTVADVEGSATGAIVSLGGGLYRLSTTLTAVASGVGNVSVFLQAAATTRSAAWTAIGTENALLWGADLRLGASAGTYQRIAATYP